MTQEDYLKHILELKKEHPEMEIKFCVDSNEISDSKYTYHQIFKVEISKWYEDMFGYFYTDKHNIVEDIKYNLFESDTVLTDTDQGKIAEDKYNNLPFVICVYTEAGWTINR